MRRLAAAVLTLLTAASPLAAATLSVTVRNHAGRAVQDAVVYLLPEGRKLPLARRSAVMDQKNRMFVPHVLAVQTGTAVSFPNNDEIHHQVYSFSSPKSFQLPLYKGTPANPVTFEKAGVVSLGCNIHDKMSAFVVVVDTPYFAVTSADGRVDLRDVDEGKYQLRLWTAGGGEENATPLSLSENSRREVTLNTRK